VSADLINLRRVKKNKAREETEKQAKANRQKFGRTKTEKTLTQSETARAQKTFDGHKRED
jgi:Domain of unknown function (DUF4169)